MPAVLRLCACGAILKRGERNKTGRCQPCSSRHKLSQIQRTKALAVAVDATLDWASDPCKRCGKHPLSIFNKTGYCRKCSRNHVARLLYPKKSHGDGRETGHRRGKKESLANR